MKMTRGYAVQSHLRAGDASRTQFINCTPLPPQHNTSALQIPLIDKAIVQRSVRFCQTCNDGELDCEPWQTVSLDWVST